MYAQAAVLAAKFSKQIAIVVVIGIVLFAIWAAVKSYEGLQEDLVQSEMARGAQEVAHKTTSASLLIQEQATARWQASAVKYKQTLRWQEKAREAAREESRRIDETLREHDLTKLALAKPELIERAVNRGTARVIRVLNCSSTSRGCDEDGGAAGRDSGDSVSDSTEP